MIYIKNKEGLYNMGLKNTWVKTRELAHKFALDEIPIWFNSKDYKLIPQLFILQYSVNQFVIVNDLIDLDLIELLNLSVEEDFIIRANGQEFSRYLLMKYNLILKGVDELMKINYNMECDIINYFNEFGDYYNEDVELQGVLML